MKLIVTCAALTFMVAAGASANELKLLKQGRYEPVGTKCSQKQGSGDFVAITDNGRGYSEWGLSCQLTGISKAGGYKMHCDDWEGGEPTKFELKAKVVSRTSLSINNLVYNWCASK